MTLLQVYADDSGKNAPPVSVLAGWIAEADTWVSFSDEWDKILRMSPRIRYFKFDEAVHFSGEFHGISEKSRDEKMALFANCIVEHNLLGVRCTIIHKAFHKYFGKKGSGALRVPYPILFVRLISRVQRHYLELGPPYPIIDFIFDDQIEEEEQAIIGWLQMKKDAKNPLLSMLGSTPEFKSDKEVLPIQAADLIAGWSRYLNGSEIEARPIHYPEWSKRLNEVKVITWTMDEYVAKDVKETLE